MHGNGKDDHHNHSDNDASWESSLGDVLDSYDDDDIDDVDIHGIDRELVPTTTRRRRHDEKRHPSTSRLTSAGSGTATMGGRRGAPTAGHVLQTTLDLAPINGAFGPKADLYRDVLGVKPNASPEQIQRSYFQRRNELFKLLSDLDGDEAADPRTTFSSSSSSRVAAAATTTTTTAAKRESAERKMDGVVMAMRILGDPDLRARYDDVRADRLRGRVNASPARPQKVSTTVAATTTATTTTTLTTSSEHRPKETIRVETTTTTHNKKKKNNNTVAAATPTSTTRKKPQNESPPSSPPQPPKKKQQQQQLQHKQRDEEEEAEEVPQGAPAKQPNKFYRRMVPVLDRSSRAASAFATTTPAKKKLTSKVRPGAVSPEKPVRSRSTADAGKKGVIAAAAVASSARWLQQQQQPPQNSTKAASAATPTVKAKERGIRFDMDRREYPAPKAEDYNDDHDDEADDTTTGSTADVNWTDEGTLLSEDPSEGTLTTAAASALQREQDQNKGFVARVSDELCGAIEDTAASFDQVFNVFTLQDEDIRAVRYRIDKFRQQVSNSL
jgi:curved DNA-binding protein CbpA